MQDKIIGQDMNIFLCSLCIKFSADYGLDLLASDTLVLSDTTRLLTTESLDMMNTNTDQHNIS